MPPGARRLVCRRARGRAGRRCRADARQLSETAQGVKDGRGVVCAFVSVPARHGARSSKRYRVAVSVVKARRGGSTRRPLVILGGGPGEAIAALGPLIASPPGSKTLFGRLAQKRDVIFFDQRGAGASEPSLECTREEKTLAPTDDDAANAAAGVRAYSACAARLKAAGIDLSTFTTSQIAYDVRRVVSELDLGRVDVLGVSHGTQVALLAASRGEAGAHGRRLGDRARSELRHRRAGTSTARSRRRSPPAGACPRAPSAIPTPPASSSGSSPTSTPGR